MTIEPGFAWLGLLLLGAVHGINPGMGWLFAVALGMQERRTGAVWAAMGPLGVGHALAVGSAIAVAALAGVVIPLEILKWVIAAVLLVLGVSKLLRSSHPRWGGMRVGRRELTIWSFLMASAHGAGLMVLPLFVGLAGAGSNHDHLHGLQHAHTTHGPTFGPPGAISALLPGDGTAVAIGSGGGVTAIAWMATLAHTIGYLLVTALTAIIVYRWLGVALLRRVWFNIDRVWAMALIATALVTPLL